MRWFTDTCRAVRPDCYIVGEAWTDRQSIADLYRSDIDSLFDFPFSGNEGVICPVLNGSRRAEDYVQEMIRTQETFSAANQNYIDAPFYTNHDMGRSAGYYWENTAERIKLAYAMNLLMSGNAFVYYGEELGMAGAGRDENKRAPMYWDYDRSAAGMCTGPYGMDAAEMPFPPLSQQQNDPSSIYQWFTEVIRVRKSFPVIARGSTAAAGWISNDAIAAFIRYADGEDPVLIVMNLRGESRDADLSGLNEDLNLSAVLITNGEQIVYENRVLHLPAYSIAVLTEAGS
jgi:glycosidase